MTENKTPLITIIIPTFNRIQVLKRAVQSVFSQTIKDWELIIVDDGSSDGTDIFLSELIKKDSRISFFISKINGGPSSARNIGLENANGKYIAFLDSDDEWLPEKLELQLESFNKDDEIGLVYTGALFICGDKERVKKVKENGYIYEKEIIDNPIGGCSRVMIKSECLDKSGFFDKTLHTCEDWDLWIRISKYYKIGFIDIPLVKYIESSDSISINSFKLIDGYKKIWGRYDLLSKGSHNISKNYLRLGHRLCYYGDYKIGRSYVIKAFLLRPFNIKNIFIFILSLSGSKFYKFITFYLMKIF